MLTTTQAAALLGIKSAMARRYCEEGRLAATQVGGRWITTREAVETFRPTMNKPGRPSTRKETTMTNDELLKLIDDSLPTDEDRAAQIRHQNARDEQTIIVLEQQLETGEYSIVGRYPATRQDIIEAIAGYRAMIEKRSATR